MITETSCHEKKIFFLSRRWASTLLSSIITDRRRLDGIVRSGFLVSPPIKILYHIPHLPMFHRDFAAGLTRDGFCVIKLELPKIYSDALARDLYKRKNWASMPRLAIVICRFSVYRDVLDSLQTRSSVFVSSRNLFLSLLLILNYFATTTHCHAQKFKNCST